MAQGRGLEEPGLLKGRCPLRGGGKGVKGEKTGGVGGVHLNRRACTQNVSLTEDFGRILGGQEPHIFDFEEPRTWRGKGQMGEKGEASKGKMTRLSVLSRGGRSHA